MIKYYLRTLAQLVLDCLGSAGPQKKGGARR